jgi:DNA-binding MarR family transcriptional regulator
MPDDIEQLVDDWTRERPDLDISTIALLARVSRLAHRFDEAQRSGVAALGLKPGWLDVLGVLRRAGSPYRLSPTELASATLLSSGGMTSRLDRLEEAGLVRRKPDPADRRGVIVELTAEGRRITDAAIDEHGELGERLLMPLARSERQALLQLLRKLLAALEHPESPTEEEGAPEPQLTASWIPHGRRRVNPRDSARRARRPREGRRGPSR